VFKNLFAAAVGVKKSVALDMLVKNSLALLYGLRSMKIKDNPFWKKK